MYRSQCILMGSVCWTGGQSATCRATSSATSDLGLVIALLRRILSLPDDAIQQPSRLDNPHRFLHTGNIPYSRKRATNGLLWKTPQIPGIQWEPAAEHRHHDGPRVGRLGHPRGHHPVFILADPTRRFSD